MERFKNLFSKIKFRRSKNQNTSNAENQDGGKLWATWLFILPLLVGLALGRLGAAGLSYAIENFAGNAGVKNMAINHSNDANSNNDTARGLDDFLANNPFKLSPMKADEKPAPVKQEEPKPKTPEVNILDNLIVRGTFPNVGAWIENQGKLSLLLIGKSFQQYKLLSVSYNEAVFQRDGKNYTCRIVYGPTNVKPAPEPPKASTPAPAPAQNNKADGIVAAEPGQQEGQISSEVVNQLVQNPFDELKRIRMRPNESAGGLEVQWIQNESILKRLGVQRGDIIKSVNGIPFTNMGDIANSLNSLMSSERFDVEVTRGGKSTALRYVVK